jgi:hypothetical protein
MLEISERQLDAMLPSYRRDASRRLTLHLRDAFPEELAGVAYDDAYAWVYARMRTAQAMGFADLRHLFLYVSLGIVLGDRYADEPAHGWVDRMLADQALGRPADRMAVVMDLCRGE